MYRLFLIFPMLKTQPQSQSTGFGNNHTQFIRSGLLHTPASHIIIKSGSILHLLSGMRYQYSSTDNSSGSYYCWDSDRPRSTFSRQRNNPTAYRHRTKTNSYPCPCILFSYFGYIYHIEVQSEWLLSLLSSVFALPYTDLNLLPVSLHPKEYSNLFPKKNWRNYSQP